MRPPFGFFEAFNVEIRQPGRSNLRHFVDVASLQAFARIKRLARFMCMWRLVVWWQDRLVD